MNDVRELIRRARKLAALADNATPGPWEVIDQSGWEVYRSDMDYCDDPYCSCQTEGLVATAESATRAVQDARLIAAAPEMALLLRQIADELEEAIR